MEPQREILPGRKRIFALGLAASLVLASYVALDAGRRTTHGFAAYYTAARLLLSGRLGPDVYADEWFAARVREDTRSGIIEVFGPNPPTMALLAVPVAALEHGFARGVWLVASLALFVVACAALVRAARPPGAWRGSALVVLLLLTQPVFANLRTGQVYLLVFSCYAAAVLLLMHKRGLRHEMLGGALLGLALALKSSGAPLAALLLLRGRFRALAGALTVCAAAAAVLAWWSGSAIWLRYAGYVAEFVQRPAASVTAYQTTTSLVRRLCVSDPVWNPAPAASCAPIAIALPVLLLGGAFAVTAWASRRVTLERWLAAGVCLSVLMLPIGAEQHAVLLGVPLALLVRARARALVEAKWPWAVLAALLFVPLDWTALRFTEGWAVLLAYPRLYAGWLLWGMTIGGQRTVDHHPPGVRTHRGAGRTL